MIDDRFSLRNGSRVLSQQRDPEAEVEYLLSAEEQLLHEISAGMPLTSILHKICETLNSDIGNIISMTSLPDDDATALAAIAKYARIFGLHKFCSAPVVGGNNEALGSIEIYCSVPRRPFLNEIRLIERATCLATVAITRQKDSGCQVSRTSALRICASGAV